MLVDTEGLGLQHVTNISPIYAKKIAGLLQVTVL